MPEQLLNDIRTTLAAARSQLEYLSDLGVETLCRHAAAGDLTQNIGASASLEETLDAIRQDLGDCQRCGLAASRKQLVYGIGNPNARLVLVGEAPGRHAQRAGLGAVGLGVGLSPWPEDFEVCGQEWSNRGPRCAEMIEIIRGLTKGGYYYSVAVRQAVPVSAGGLGDFRFTDLYGEARFYRSPLRRLLLRLLR